MPPRKRPPGRGGGGGGGSKTMLTWAILLLLTAAVQTRTAQHSKETLSASTHTVISNDRRAPRGYSPPEIPALKHDTYTQKFHSSNEDAINRYEAEAPARDIPAVRAPPLQQASSSQGRLALSQARLPGDWEAENIILLATLDGQLHARDRNTGNKRWSLGTPENPMIQTIHHCNNKTDNGDGDCEHELIFIVEPTKDGNLYVRHKDPQIGLQRLGMTVKDVFEETPLLLDEPPLAMVAKKETTGYVVDAASGNILQQYSSSSVFFNDDEQQSCRRVSGFELDDTACTPIGKLDLGRVEYTISISDRLTPKLLCTIKFAEWVPNNRDKGLQSQYVSPLDDLHIQLSSSGRVLGLTTDVNARQAHVWNQPPGSPVARVFDVVRPSGDQTGDMKLVLLARPIEHPSLTPEHLLQNDAYRSDKVFINKTDSGVWYAMSELSYPGITAGASSARSEKDPEVRVLNSAKNMEDIIGVHTLSAVNTESPVRLTIEGRQPVQDIIPEPEKALDDPQAPKPPGVLFELPNSWSIVFNVILLGIVLLVVGIQLRLPRMLQLQNLLQRAGIEIALTQNKAVNQAALPESLQSEEIPVAETTEPEKENVIEVVEEVLNSAVATPMRSRSQSHLTPNISPKKQATFDDEDDNSSDSGSEEEKDKPVSGDQPSGTDGGAVPKRRAKRGKRGGRKNKKKKAMDPEAMNETATFVNEIPTKEGLLQVGRLRIDIKEDTCLGRGSNGTAVFPGTLDGEEVAVKRLIRSSNSLAAKEIKHLLSSKQNTHVIRFLLKEESHHFTYIALDLFMTSLDQFVERPEKYPSLVKMPEGYDIKDCLKQITDGVGYLHSLKLVHRDLKPQNVLVNPVKSSRPAPGLPKLHYVISDFGLAKPLEEGPESTFAPTANHTAAGTTGWRAPELLVNHRENIAAPPCTDSSTSKSTSQSADGTVVDRSSGRRATKAIDIFSLGCLFYYVMTQGRHPFDKDGSSLGRDLNIKNNNFTTEHLGLFEYSYEGEDLIMQMINHDPKSRPDTGAVLGHPYFWPVKDKLEFLLAVSDCFENEKSSIKDIHNPDAHRTAAELDAFGELDELETLAPNVIGRSNNFLRALPQNFINEMGKQRKYSGNKMIDLLRAIRNKRNHFRDLPEDIKKDMDYDDTGGYYRWWMRRFPSLLVNCHCLVIERGLVERWRSQRLGDIISGNTSN